MNIIRDGKEFILTPEELLQAYLEQEHLYDLSNIRNNMEGYLNEPVYHRLKGNESYIESAANKLRENIDSSGMAYDNALSVTFDETVKDFLLPVNRVRFTRERYSEHQIWNSDFWVDASKTPTKELFMEAIEEFLLTKEGQQAVSDTCNDFNWGDVEFYVPEEIFNKYGIYSFDYSFSPQDMGLAPTTSDHLFKIAVDQDEVLIPSDYADRLAALKAKKPSLQDKIQDAASRISPSTPSFEPQKDYSTQNR